MGIFSKIKGGISSKANAALDKAIDPEKELEMAILELEEGRKKALAELISYKATAKQLDMEIEKQRTKATEWERRAMVALKAGDEGSAREALKKKKECEIEANKIERDKHEAASYAIQLNKSRKEFETKLQVLKLRKGTLAMQIAAARSPGGDAFGNDSSVWDKFQRAEDRIDAEAIETEVDAAMRGEDADAVAFAFDKKLEAATATAGALPAGSPDDPLAALKSKMADAKAAKQKQLGPASPAPAAKPALPAAKPEAPAAKPEASAAKPAAPAARAAADKPAAATAATPAAKAEPSSVKAPSPAAKTEAPAAKLQASAAKPEAKPPAKAESPAAKPGAEGAGGEPAAEPPRPVVKIDENKLEAELAALRAAAARGELDDK